MRLRHALLGGLLAVLASITASCGSLPLAPEAPWASHMVDPPTPAADFVLREPDGSRVALSDFRGQFVVLYFGYTHCPDVCPTTLGTFSTAFKQLPPDVRSRLKFVMVTVDPARDTPEVMGKYTSHFASDFLGLSGSQSETDEIVRTWQLPVECGEVQPDGSYSVSHPASAYVIDPQGSLRLHVSFTLTPDEVAADLQRLVKKG